MVFVLLGDKYLRALSLPVKTQHTQTFIFFGANKSLNYIHAGDAKSFILTLSNDDASRIDGLPYFRHLGITSFDSASPLRKAWFDAKENYHTINGKPYAAVRIPFVDKFI